MPSSHRPRTSIATTCRRDRVASTARLLSTPSAPPFLHLLLLYCACILTCLTAIVSGLPQSGNADNRNATASNSSSSVVPLGTRAVFGLGKDWMQKNSIYIGFLPDWSRESPVDINRNLGKAMAIV